MKLQRLSFLNRKKKVGYRGNLNMKTKGEYK